MDQLIDWKTRDTAYGTEDKTHRIESKYKSDDFFLESQIIDRIFALCVRSAAQQNDLFVKWNRMDSVYDFWHRNWKKTHNQKPCPIAAHCSLSAVRDNSNVNHSTISEWLLCWLSIHCEWQQIYLSIKLKEIDHLRHSPYTETHTHKHTRTH